IGHASQQPVGRTENRGPVPLPSGSERVLPLRPSGLAPVTYADRNLPQPADLRRRTVPFQKDPIGPLSGNRVAPRPALPPADEPQDGCRRDNSKKREALALSTSVAPPSEQGSGEDGATNSFGIIPGVTCRALARAGRAGDGEVFVQAGVVAPGGHRAADLF